MVNEDGNIAAYFSLSFKEISLQFANISKNAVKRIEGMNKHAEKVKVYLIGQIGKNYSIPNNTINLQAILDEVFVAIHEARRLVGGRTVILECERNSEKLLEHYKKHGFEVLINAEGDLITMYICVA